MCIESGDYLSKYNNMKSIMIDKLSEKELNIAIKEWAENDNSLEKLLWSCYNNGVQTSGCHVGAYSYLSIHVNDSKKEVIKLLDAFQKIKGTKIVIMPDGGNPFSGEDWYEPGLTFCFQKLYKKETDEILDSLTDTLNNKKERVIKENFFSKMLELYNFFAYKESGLSFTGYYTEEQNYKFIINLWSKKNKFDYFNNLLSKSGLIHESNTENKPFESWSIETNKLEEIIDKTKYCINYIINNYNLELPNSINELTNFHEIALFKKREFGDSLEGKEQFNQWLENERKNR